MQCLVASAFRKGLLPSQSHLLGDLIHFSLILILLNISLAVIWGTLK